MPTDGIKAVFDELPERIGQEVGLTGILIRDFLQLTQYEYDAGLILAWSYAEEIINKWPHRRKLLMVPLPGLLERWT